MIAKMISEDGKRWLRITPPDGFEWDEPIGGWQLIIHLFDGEATWKHQDGRQIKDQP